MCFKRRFNRHLRYLSEFPIWFCDMIEIKKNTKKQKQEHCKETRSNYYSHPHCFIFAMLLITCQGWNFDVSLYIMHIFLSVIKQEIHRNIFLVCRQITWNSVFKFSFKKSGYWYVIYWFRLGMLSEMLLYAIYYLLGRSPSSERRIVSVKLPFLFVDLKLSKFIFTETKHWLHNMQTTPTRIGERKKEGKMQFAIDAWKVLLVEHTR